MSLLTLHACILIILTPDYFSLLVGLAKHSTVYSPGVISHKSVWPKIKLRGLTPICSCATLIIPLLLPWDFRTPSKLKGFMRISPPRRLGSTI